MSDMTITEALAELKTINKRIEAKRQFVLSNAVRHGTIKDPFEKKGTTQETRVAEERQAIGDMIQRYIRIRKAIADKNSETVLTVEGATRSVTEWLIWRREQASAAGATLVQLRGAAQGLRAEIVKRVGAPDGSGDDKFQAIVNFDEGALAAAIENHETVLGTLDGLLSLHNARTQVTV